MTAPILRRPLRKVHDAIICAALEGDWARAERHLASAPATYQAVTALLSFLKRLNTPAGPAAVSSPKKAQKPAETAPSAMALALRRWKVCSGCKLYAEFGCDYVANPQPGYLGGLLADPFMCADCAHLECQMEWLESLRDRTTTAVASATAKTITLPEPTEEELREFREWAEEFAKANGCTVEWAADK